MELASGHTWHEEDPEEKVKYQKTVTGILGDLITLKPKGWKLPRSYLKYQDKIYNFKFRSDDVVIMTYPKCGTTWMQEIIWTMLNNPNLDNPESRKHLFSRSPFLESDMLFEGKPHSEGDDILKKFKEICPGGRPEDGAQLQIAEALPSRRAIKTHLPFSLLCPDLLTTAKVIYVARNPKDTCLSFQHHHEILSILNFVDSQDTFVNYFVDERLIFAPYHEITKEAWAVRDHPNIHFVFYEDMKTDIDEELKKIDKFIGTDLTEQQLNNVKEFTSFGHMKSRNVFRNSSSEDKEDGKIEEDRFFRKGVSGGWREKLTKEQSDKIDAYVKKYLDPTGISFKF